MGKPISEDWDFTTTRRFLESKAAEYYPEYWQAKVKAIGHLRRESRRGLLDFSLSCDFSRSVPLADEWSIYGFPENFPEVGGGGSVPEFFGGLLRGILLYDELLWDASILERDIIGPPLALDERGKQERQTAKLAAVSHMVELMDEGLVVPHCGYVGLSDEQYDAVENHADRLSRDRVIQRIVRKWDYEDIDDASMLLPAFIMTLAFSQKYNASIISRSNEQALYDRILWHSSMQSTDKNLQNSLRELLSVSLPTYDLTSIDHLIGLKKESCVRHFRDRVWSVCSSRMETSRQSFLDLMRELDEDRKDLAEAMESLSKMKLVWSIVTILTSPVFSLLPFPVSLAPPAISLATREAAASFLEKKAKAKYSWVFTIDKVKRLFVPWERAPKSSRKDIHS